MSKTLSKLQLQIEEKKQILVLELSPPTNGDPSALIDTVQRVKDKVHAIGVNSNRGQVRMSALAAASLVSQQGIEPIMHVVTRDQNRIALMSECLGAQALGIRNLLCTTGTHQTLGHFKSSKNVFDLDSIQLLQTYKNLSNTEMLVGDQFEFTGALCLGGVASPYADPMELQLIKLQKKCAAGAQFIITQPVFDVARFNRWWKEIETLGLHEKVAILAGIKPLTNAESAQAYSKQRPLPLVPEAMLNQLGSSSKPSEQRAIGIDIAVETIGQLKKLSGLRGFEIQSDTDVDAALEIIDKSGLRMN